MHYDSPLGKILLAADEEGMTGVWFEAQKYFAAKLPPENEEGTMPVLGDACRWLDVYFSGREPDFTPKLHLIGSDFRSKPATPTTSRSFPRTRLSAPTPFCTFSVRRK